MANCEQTSYYIEIIHNYEYLRGLTDVSRQKRALGTPQIMRTR